MNEQEKLILDQKTLQFLEENPEAEVFHNTFIQFGFQQTSVSKTTINYHHRTVPSFYPCLISKKFKIKLVIKWTYNFRETIYPPVICPWTLKENRQAMETALKYLQVMLSEVLRRSEFDSMLQNMFSGSDAWK